MDIVYGYKLQSDNDPFIKLADDAWAGLKESGNHGSFMVDYLPILKRVPCQYYLTCLRSRLVLILSLFQAWLPGAGFKRKAAEWGWFTDELKDRPWRWLKKSIVSEFSSSSFTKGPC